MAPYLRSHASGTSVMSRSTMYRTSPQWIQDLDPSNETDAVALMSIFDPSCRVARKSCNRCSYLKLECLVAPTVPSHCVACFARGDYECTTCPSGMYDGDTEIDEDDDVITSATRRQRRKTRSDTTSAATETKKTQTGNPQNALKNGRKPTEVYSVARIISPSATPRVDATREERASYMKQQNRSSVQNKILDKPGILIPNGVKRKRLELDITAEAVTQSASITGLSSSQSHHFPKHRYLKPIASIEAATTEAAAQTVGAVEPLPTQSHQSRTDDDPQSSTRPKGATEATQTVRAAEASSIRSHQSPEHWCVRSDTSTEAAAEVKHTLIRAQSSSAQSNPFPKLLEIPNPIKESSSTHETPIPSIPQMSIGTQKQNKTTMWISIPSSTDAVPLTLRSCMTISSLFHSVYKICGLSERQQQDKVLGLRTTLEWTHDVGGVKKYLMLKRDYEDSFDVFLRIIDALPCWEQEGGCCSVAIEVVMMD